MIEVHLAYDVITDIDEQRYFEWMKKAIVPALKSRGMLEVRAYRNTNETHRVLVVGVWEKPEDWTDFSQSEAGSRLLIHWKAPLLRIFALKSGVPRLIPAPLRAHKQG